MANHSSCLFSMTIPQVCGNDAWGDYYFILFLFFSSDTNIPEIREETEPSLVQEVRSKISDAGCYSLPEVIHLMVRPIHEAILKDALPLSWYSQVEERIGELRRGHLASGTEDDSPGAIHWYEGGLLIKT